MTKTKATTEYGEMPERWNGAWETLLKSAVEGRMGVLEDELMIQ